MELLGSDLCHPDDYDAIYREFVQLLRGGRNESMRTESRTRHKDGTVHLGRQHRHQPSRRSRSARHRRQHPRHQLPQGGRARAAGERGSLALGGRRIADRHLRARPRLRSSPSSTNAGRRSPAWPTRRRSAARGSRSSIPTTARRWRISGRRRARRACPSAAMFRVVRPDGEVRWLMSATEPLFDETGVLTGHVGTIDDITERLVAHARHRAAVRHRRGHQRPGRDQRPREPHPVHERGGAPVLRLGPVRAGGRLRLHAVHAAVGAGRVSSTTHGRTCANEGIWGGEFAILPRRCRGSGVRPLPCPQGRRRSHRVRVVGDRTTSASARRSRTGSRTRPRTIR